jgi:hypothetical protein
VILSDGAGAIYLRTEPGESAVQLSKITDAHPFLKTQNRYSASRRMRAELDGATADSVLCDGAQGIAALDKADTEAWRDWPGARLSPKIILGEGLMAAAAWQCVAAIDALRQKQFRTANVSVVGCNQQAIGAQFISNNSPA